MHKHTFIREIETFDINQYLGLIGWIGHKPQKIYTSIDYQSFYLHDEITDRLFEFEAELTSFEGFGQYERVIEAYLAAYR